MKKLLYFTLLICFTSCVKVYKVEPLLNNYNENLEFKIKNISIRKTYQTGGGIITANKGYRFVEMDLDIFNRTNVDRKINYRDFYLLDFETKNKFPLQWNQPRGPILWMGKKEKEIKSDKIKKRRLVFIFPQDRKPKFLIVGDELVEIPYKS
tara:strand:- start:1466 stop:1921 length:456 start_codon:yes stop_codon:yes gene_type:complete